MGKVSKGMLPEQRFHEESLLAQRLMIFLLFNSILFLGFVGLLDSDYLLLKRIVPFAGIVAETLTSIVGLLVIFDFC